MTSKSNVYRLLSSIKSPGDGEERFNIIDDSALRIKEGENNNQNQKETKEFKTLGISNL